MKYYLHVEGVNLAHFIYDTNDLSTVRGGSLLLLEATQTLQDAQPTVMLEPISTGASLGLFTFDAANDKAAADIRQQIVKTLNRDEKLRHATFVVDVQRASRDYEKDREALRAKNRWRQMRQPTLAIPAWHPHPDLDVCSLDRSRPAVTTIATPENPQTPVSASVQVRRTWGA